MLYLTKRNNHLFFIINLKAFTCKWNPTNAHTNVDNEEAKHIIETIQIYVLQ